MHESGPLETSAERRLLESRVESRESRVESGRVSSGLSTLDSRHPWKRVVLAVGVAIVLIQWVRVAVAPRGDFPLHWELGRRLAEGEFIYEGGHDYPYPPFWALAHAPLSTMPLHAAQVLLFPLILVAMFALFWVLDRLSRDHLRIDSDALFWVIAAAIALSSRFIVRDMMECGVNLALVALCWLAVYLWVRRRELLGGTSLGLAMSLKCTPALFLAYFVWKRQWKMAAATAAAAAAFTLSPMIVMGPAEYAHAGRYWFVHAWRGMSKIDPSQGVLGPEPLQNISLRPSLARFLMRLPKDHIARLDHPFYVDFLDLPPQTAGMIVRLIMLMLLGTVAWSFRQKPRVQGRGSRVQGPEPEAALFDPGPCCWECAAVSLMMLLYSPITWGQHCVAVIPALYLIIRAAAAHGRLPRWMNGVLATYVVFILGMNRAFVGQQISWLLDSYHVHTWCLLALLAVTMGCRSRLAADVEAPVQHVPTDRVQPNRQAA